MIKMNVCSNFFLMFLLSFSCLYSSDLVLQKALSLVPTNPKEVEEYTKKGIDDFQKELHVFVTQKAEDLSFETTVVFWNRLVEQLWAKFVTLSCLSLTTQDEMTLQAAKQCAVILKRELELGCSSAEALSMILHFATSSLANTLTLDEKYQLFLLLKSVENGWREEAPLRAVAVREAEKLKQEPLLPYTYKAGQKGEKKAIKALSILNWNVCFFGDGLSMLFGGVLPWQDRLEKVAAEIRASRADIVCLQEVFSKEAAMHLFSLLADQYAHFYLNVGPKTYGFNANDLGISSGLFIASKCPIENSLFIPFKSQETPKERAYGFFSLEIKNIGTFITTHLQPGDGSEDVKYRSLQIEAILKHAQNSPLSTFVCGDFNLEHASSEYQKTIAPYFKNFMNGAFWTCFELRDYYWKANQNVAKFLKLGIPYETIDYFLEVKKTEAESVKEVRTRVIEVNRPSEPRDALSDHQILLSYLNFGAPK